MPLMKCAKVTPRPVLNDASVHALVFLLNQLTRLCGWEVQR